MRFKFLVPVLAVVLFAAVADAGPLARLRARFGGRSGGCGQAVGQPAAPVFAPAQPQQQGVVHQVVYNPGDGVPVSNAVYQPIRLTSPLPTCPTCPK